MRGAQILGYTCCRNERGRVVATMPWRVVELAPHPNRRPRGLHGGELRRDSPSVKQAHACGIVNGKDIPASTTWVLPVT